MYGRRKAVCPIVRHCCRFLCLVRAASSTNNVRTNSTPKHRQFPCKITRHISANSTPRTRADAKPRARATPLPCHHGDFHGVVRARCRDPPRVPSAILSATVRRSVEFPWVDQTDGEPVREQSIAGAGHARTAAAFTPYTTSSEGGRIAYMGIGSPGWFVKSTGDWKSDELIILTD
ncbi:hypothetical protein [Oryza sativa Japonica Group]|uniref:Uncharacterized protein n=1 Tax=Oryza sativa subsp. japonica TaxID=39947 RepID=Q5N862_ORYSJ|nr:hypothetical protein [Oryza sativa Japonica Group]BAD82347.1 hypothetical protein [Oryza sativa Japonica Group]